MTVIDSKRFISLGVQTCTAYAATTALLMVHVPVLSVSDPEGPLTLL
jgi:hypothetical protein